MLFRSTCDYDVTSHLGITLTKTDEGVKLTQPKLLKEILDYYSIKTRANYPAKPSRKQMKDESPSVTEVDSKKIFESPRQVDVFVPFAS